MTTLRTELDDLGSPVRLGAVRRVVSLVPSLTEAIAATEPELLVGATDWCSHPAELAVARIGGTKNPDPARIAALAPDLVLANQEENRAVDLAALRAAGLPVWVTDVRSLPQAIRSLERLLTTACRLTRPDWLEAAAQAWQFTSAAAPIRAVAPIWRRPWMVLGRDTFAGDLLARLGVELIHADHAERYPAIPLPELLAARPELVVLPDEPYRFTGEDGPESFPELPCALVSGRHLTWYGPSLAEAPAVLAGQLAVAG
ncbi:ABC transporter substrate-binding protein [Kitasatospora sp. MMS16-BH015]|uniref:helical backbone metal receptor n=1 Tax=Kitasatospora sp. MMS16-BH015 TaxID=2018025 RepID=UPI000CA0BBDF|nr:helical backbone metal receptor [Kitasatospora sp. MMS16-BH015]AUG75534.1 ABC transporter substrate-binding protein [Kitasatospora sp. MMS16-BH015]